MFLPLTPTNYDLLIIDEKHVMISFTVVRNATKIQSGLAFINEPKIATEMVKWFDNVLMNKAIPVSDYVEQTFDGKISHTV